MKKILIPTDFSDTAKNAARFAAQVANDIPGASIILYHVHDSYAGGVDSSPLTETESDRMLVFGRALQNLKAELQPLTKASIEPVADLGTTLVSAVERYVQEQNIDLVVMGITGASRVDQIFIGSNTLRLVESARCPVMIIPPDATYGKIRNLAFLSDLRNVEDTTPLASITAVLDLFRPRFHIVHVDQDSRPGPTEEDKTERASLENMFQAYKPEFDFIHQEDFQEAISQFTKDKNIDLLVIVPRKTSFLSGLFKTTHTSRLAYHSHVPIVAVK